MSDPFASAHQIEASPPINPVPHVPRVPQGDSRDRGHGVTRWTASELLAVEFPEPRWSVPGLIPEGLTLFVGAPKIGKSWFQLGLGVAVASGGVALGRIPVDQGDVLYLALEDHPRRLQERLRTVLNGGEASKRLTIELVCPPLALGGRSLISKWITEHPDARLIMIDVLARVRGVPTNGVSAYDADYLAVAAAKELADEHGIAVVVAHHDRKLKADDWVDNVSGTHGLAAAADTVAVLSRPRGNADGHLKITGRDVDEAEYALRFDPSLACWSLLEGPALDHIVSDTRAAILRQLRTDGPAQGHRRGARPGPRADQEDVQADGRRRPDRHRRQRHLLPGAQTGGAERPCLAGRVTPATPPDTDGSGPRTWSWPDRPGWAAASAARPTHHPTRSTTPNPSHGDAAIRSIPTSGSRPTAHATTSNRTSRV